MSGANTRTPMATHTTAAAETNYYPSEDGMFMSSSPTISIQAKTSANVTTTIEATLGDTSLDGEQEEWIEVTASTTDLNAGLSSPPATPIKNASMILQINGIDVHKIRVKSVSTAAGETERYIFRGM